MDFKEVVKNRYSCKKYSDRVIEKEKLDAILEAGRLAPTAKNLQEQHIYVVQNKEILEDIDKYEAYCKEHPLFVNNKAIMAIEIIKDAYQDCIEHHSFLVYKKNIAS